MGERECGGEREGGGREKGGGVKPEQPEEIVSDVLVEESSLQEKTHEFRVEIRFVFQHLHKLQQVHLKIRVTEKNTI